MSFKNNKANRTGGDKVFSRKGNSPDHLLRSLNYYELKNKEIPNIICVGLGAANIF
jgi:hypothetical protein